MEWTRLHSTNNNFVRVASAALQAVARCNLDWCTTLKIHGPNFGGWVSENYLALARINRWLYSILSLLKKDEDYVEPNRLHTTWNLKELKGWLRCNGLSDKGRKSELLVRVSVAKVTISTQPEEV